MEFLILSDIHYGDLCQFKELQSPSENDEVHFSSIASKISEALLEENLAPKFLLIPGDLTSRGSPLEFSKTSRFLEILATKINIPSNRVIHTYGNHDVDWKVCDIVPSHSEHSKFYQRLSAGIGPLFTNSNPPHESAPTVGAGKYVFDDLEIILLNSGIRCYSSASVGGSYANIQNGKLDSDQLKWLRALGGKAAGVARVVVIHHHLANLPYPRQIRDLSCLEEGPEALQEFGRLGIDLVIHGHRHHPIIKTQLETGWQQPITFACAGSFGVNCEHRDGGRIPNTMHVVKFSGVADTGNRFGRMYTYQEVSDLCWKLIRNETPNVAVDPVQWFGAASTAGRLKDKVVELIKELEGARGKLEFIRLPLFEELNLDIKCHRLNSINDAFAEVASEFGYQMSGKYMQEEPLLVKR